METLISLDTQCFLWLNNLGSDNFDGFWLFVTNKYNSIPLYLFLLFYTQRAFGWKHMGLILLTVAIVVLATDQTTNFFKHTIQRLRPCHNPDLEGLIRVVKANCGGQYGFFSGHASNSFAVATFFYSIFRKHSPWFYLLFLWAAVVAYSRIYVGVHYPIDIIVGALVGGIYGLLFHQIQLFVFKK